MGQLRFRVHERDRLGEDGLGRIYVAGMEDIPWATKAHWDNDILVVRRSVSDSGNIFVPWNVEGHGRQMLASTTLMERERPYTLEVELARGLIQRLRARLFIWEWLGLEAPSELSDQLQDATQQFSRAATNQHDLARAANAASDAIRLGLDVSNLLVECYTKQAMAKRQHQTPSSTLLGVNLGPMIPTVELRRQLVDATNIMQLPIGWRAIESEEGRRNFTATDEQLGWCQKAGLKVAAGPLLRLDDSGIPLWMYVWEGEDYEQLSRMMLEHVRAVVTRYAGRVHLWHVASRVNTGRLLALDEEQRLNLVAQAIQTVKQIDPRTPTVVSFDQPWGEYMAGQNEDLAPLHFADALLRADLGVSGFGLEINSGYWPHGSVRRPSFELGRLIDQWSLLGVPLMALLSTASKSDEDGMATAKTHVEPAAATQQADTQLAWAQQVVPLLLARPTIQVILWNQLSDALPHEFPHGGLFDAQENAKPTLAYLRDLRKSCLV
ncbi:endo-1,4-beta-xylanase [Adhaeretor mobilis]|uniref:GH10 domain-containing protein n=1 Tax=Adhaeretor mobilis TaxID=1930276 RepID=A0A517N0H5_9BACT|nr:endo-1,4-beta-xylanase [Adhaeretor mobilis]QDT00639.1 hypothetical protein HG15A2_39780 [Adhaeretor mobilis]